MSANEPMGPLVDVAWLASNATREDVRIIDFRWYLAGKQGAAEYATGHVAGAVFLDLETELTAKKGPGRHPIPGGGQMERAMRKAGVNSDTFVVVYDDAGGSIAARLWWLLRYYGHRRAAVLDGGINAWIAAGNSVTSDNIAYPEGNFTAGPPDSDRVVDKEYVNAARERSDVVMIDARARERYRGESEPIDARPGHIPGARNAPWSENLEQGKYLAGPTLREKYLALGAGEGETIVYCGSGVTACHDLLALEIAGISGAKLYAGSWSDWARDPELPAASGDSGDERS